MPIVDICFHGDAATPGSFVAEDLRLISSLPYQERIRERLKNVPIPVDLHFINLPATMFDATAIRVSRDADDRQSDDFQKYAKMLGGDLYPIGLITEDTIRNVYGAEISAKQDRAILVMVENESRAPVRFTPWMVAHRMSHVIYQTTIQDKDNRLIPIVDEFQKEINRLQDYYIPYLSEEALATFFGTTRSCQMEMLTSWGEWWHECFAQFCVTGKVRFNEPKPVMENKQGKSIRFDNILPFKKVFTKPMSIMATKIEQHFRWKFQTCFRTIHAL